MSLNSIELDDRKAEAFGARMLGIVNSSFAALLVSVGHRTGLFDTMAGLRAASSDDIAKAADLNPRYVREWLGGMVVSGVVEYDPAHRTYWLPPEHAAALTRAAGMNNLAFYTQYVGMCGLVEEKVIRCFEHGGGVHYANYPEFQRLQAEESAALFESHLVNAILPLAPSMPDRLAAGIDVCDIGCGQGRAVHVMASAYPSSRFTGMDFADEAVAVARLDASGLELTNAEFSRTDICEQDALEPSTYDLITAFDTIHDLAAPRQALANIAQALRRGGVFVMMDYTASSRLEDNIGHPIGSVLYGISVFHCMTVSLAQQGEGLGTVWGEQRARMFLAEAGFQRVEVKQIPADPMHTFFIATR